PPRHLHSFPTRRSSDLAPPFKTDMFSMSSGFKSPRPLPISAEGFQKSLFLAPAKFSIGTPSTTIKGWLSPVNDVKPRNTILDEEDRKSTRLNSSHVKIS